MTHNRRSGAPAYPRPNMINKTEVSQWLEYLCDLHAANGGKTELRIISPVKEHNTGNQFSSAESLVASLEATMVRHPEKFERVNLYTTLNPVNPIGSYAKDGDVSAYLWLPFDVDPARYEKDEFGIPQMLIDQKVPSTEEELENASKAATLIEAMVESALNVKPTVTAISGNGHHRLYRVSGTTDELKPLVHEILKTTSSIFRETPLSKHWVNVDTSVANPSRIWKLYGAVAKKGSESPGREFRMSSVVSMRPEEKPLTADDLRKLLESFKSLLGRYVKPKPEPKPVQQVDPSEPSVPFKHDGLWVDQFAGYDLLTLDVKAALTEAGYTVVKDGSVDTVHEGGEVENKPAVWIDCPNAHRHSTATGERDGIVYLPKLRDRNGKRIFASYDCFHDHCSCMRGAEYFHTKLIPPNIIKKHCQTVAMAAEPLKVPPADCVLSVADMEIPKPATLDRSKLRSLNWMLDDATIKKTEVLIPGFLYRGEILTMAAPTKIGKTFQLMHMAVAWAHGEAWMGMKATKPLKVLIIDPELIEAQAQLRLKTISINVVKGKATGVVDYYNLRVDPVMAHKDPWADVLDGIKGWLNEGMDWDLIIVDSMYKFQGDTNMNDSASVTRMLLKLKAVTGAGSEPAIIYIHHYAKGDPGLKKSMDRASGSFAFSADADCVLTITEHPLTKESGVEHYNVEFTLRHWPRRDTIVVRRRMDIPILDPVDGVSPAVDSVFLAKRRTAMEMTMILEEMMRARVSGVQPYGRVRVSLKEFRNTSMAKLGITPEAFNASLKIATEEGWTKGEGAGVARCYLTTEEGMHLTNDAKQKAEWEYIFTDAEKPGDEKPEPENPNTSYAQPYLGDRTLANPGRDLCPAN